MNGTNSGSFRGHRLELHEADVAEFDGKVPSVIEIETFFEQGKKSIILGRGSPANPVDVRFD